MNKLIEPELNPPPLDGIFLCSIVLIVFCVYIRREETKSFYQCDVT